MVKGKTMLRLQMAVDVGHEKLANSSDSDVMTISKLLSWLCDEKAAGKRAKDKDPSNLIW